MIADNFDELLFFQCRQSRLCLICYVIRQDQTIITENIGYFFNQYSSFCKSECHFFNVGGESSCEVKVLINSVLNVQKIRGEGQVSQIIFELHNQNRRVTR